MSKNNYICLEKWLRYVKIKNCDCFFNKRNDAPTYYKPDLRMLQ